MVYSGISAGYALPVPISPHRQRSLKANLKGLRESVGLTQEQLASRSKVKQAAISKWETGKTVPDLASLMRVAVGLEMPLDRILEGVNQDYDKLSRVSGTPTRHTGESDQGSAPLPRGGVDERDTARILQTARDRNRGLADEVSDIIHRLARIATDLTEESGTAAPAAPRRRRRPRTAGRGHAG